MPSILLPDLLNDDSRPLLLATAGHVNHGKSTLIEKICGVHPDRLPQEKSRGMTLDLGFAHHPEISFIDCPGHESLVRHLVAGQTGVDGALFIVAANEGLQEQSFEHARILNWVGVDQILIVITKTDLLTENENLEVIKKKVTGTLQTYFSHSTKLGMIGLNDADEKKTIEEIKLFFTKKPASLTEQRRFFIDRAFSLTGIGTVCTGTWTAGEIKKGAKAFFWSQNREKLLKVFVKSLRYNKRSLDFCTTKLRLGLNIDGAKPTDISRGSCLLFSESEPLLTKSLVLKLNFVIQLKRQFSAIMQVGSISQEVKLRLHPSGLWRAQTRVCCPYKVNDRVIVRLPNRIKNFGHIIGGGEILSLNPEQWFKKPVEIKPERVVIKNEQPLVDLPLLSSIKEKKWDAFAAVNEIQKCHDLVKLGHAVHIKDNHFAHVDHTQELLKWLNQHFEKKATLSIEDARSFFATGRKTFLSILEFCDRKHFTFRKGDSRQKFKLPPCSHQALLPPNSEHEDDKPSGKSPCSY